MNFREANQMDLNTIHEIMERAKVHMHENGINQWNEYYPYIEDYQNDIDNHSLSKPRQNTPTSTSGEMNAKINFFLT